MDDANQYQASPLLSEATDDDVHSSDSEDDQKKML